MKTRFAAAAGVPRDDKANTGVHVILSLRLSSRGRGLKKALPYGNWVADGRRSSVRGSRGQHSTATTERGPRFVRPSVLKLIIILLPLKTQFYRTRAMHENTSTRFFNFFFFFFKFLPLSENGNPHPLSTTTAKVKRPTLKQINNNIIEKPIQFSFPSESIRRRQRGLCVRTLLLLVRK